MALIKLNIGLLKAPQSDLHLEILRHTGIISLRKIKTEYEPQLLLASQMIEQKRSSSKYEVSEIERLREELQRTREELEMRNKETEQRSESFQPKNSSVDVKEMNSQISQLIGETQENTIETIIEGGSEKLKIQLEEAEQLNQQREENIKTLKEELQAQKDQIRTMQIELEKANLCIQETVRENQIWEDKYKTQEIELDQERQKVFEYKQQIDDAMNLERIVMDNQPQEELVNNNNEELNKKGETIKKYDAELRKMGEEIQRKNIDIARQGDLSQATLPRKPKIVVPTLKNFPPKSYEISPEIDIKGKCDAASQQLDSPNGVFNQMSLSPRDFDQHKSTLELQLQVKSLEKKNSQLRQSIVSLKDLFQVNGELQKLLGEKETKINTLRAMNKEIEQELAYHKNKLVSISEQLAQFENFEEKILELKDIGFEKFEPIKEKLDDLREIAENKAEMTGIIYRFATAFKQELETCKRSQEKYVEKIHELSMTNNALFEQNDEMTQILIQNDIQLSGISTKEINSTHQFQKSNRLSNSSSLNSETPVVGVLQQNNQINQENEFNDIRQLQNTSCTGPECSIF